MTSTIRFCSSCGKELPHDNVAYCPNCGIDTTVSSSVHQGPIQQSPVFVQALYKSSGTAMLIAVLGGIFGLSGIGHIYVGKVGRGITILIVGVVFLAIGVVMGLGFFASQSSSALILELTFGLSYFVLFIWQILDVKDSAKEFNDLVKTEGKEPW